MSSPRTRKRFKAIVAARYPPRKKAKPRLQVLWEVAREFEPALGKRCRVKWLFCWLAYDIGIGKPRSIRRQADYLGRGTERDAFHRFDALIHDSDEIGAIARTAKAMVMDRLNLRATLASRPKRASNRGNAHENGKTPALPAYGDFRRCVRAMIDRKLGKRPE